MYCYMYICRYIPGILCSNPILQLCGNQKLPLSLEKYVYIYMYTCDVFKHYKIKKHLEGLCPGSYVREWAG